jgi:hypothetical protein
VRITFYECDWCEVRAEAGLNDDYPRGWSDFSCPGHIATLCAECHDAARKAVNMACGAAVAEAKRKRIAVRADTSNG